MYLADESGHDDAGQRQQYAIKKVIAVEHHMVGSLHGSQAGSLLTLGKSAVALLTIRAGWTLPKHAALCRCWQGHQSSSRWLGRRYPL